MKNNIVHKLVRHLPGCKNIFSPGRVFIFFLIVAANFGFFSAVLAQEIIESSGQVFIKRGSSEYRSTGVGERLQSGDRLYLQSGAVAKVLCENSDIWRVPVGIPSSVNSGCPNWVASVFKGATRYRPGGSNPQIPYISYPRMTYLLLEKPTFRWNPVAGVTKYTVRLLGSGGLEWETEVTSSEVVYPNDAPPLNRQGCFIINIMRDNQS
ncbi:MAG: hypothetical protein AB4372_11770 [Xenococcus sp. (in: cyanobacteria)]